jgi:hypothetical protein
VPLKFRLFAGATEQTSVTAVAGLTSAVMSCPNLATFVEDELSLTATGGTALRYADSQFIFNWQTPKKAGVCYRVTMTAADGSKIVAYFKTK